MYNMVVCHAAQEASMQYREYIDKNKENVILMHNSVVLLLSLLNDCGHTHQCQSSTFQISAKWLQAFLRYLYMTSKIGLVSSGFSSYFSSSFHTYKNCHKMRTPYLIAL